MAQTVTLWGATYNNVPAIDVPSGNSTARFTDTSPTTATDPDVLSGKIYFKADGTQSTGTASGGITPTGNIDITQAGVTDVTNYATATVQQGEVNYWSKSVNSDNTYRYYTFSPNVTPGYFNTISNTPRLSLTRQSETITPSSAQQTVTPTGAYYYIDSVTVNAVPSGTEGTPTATKGTVSNHSISVTPSVTNSAGYISGGTHNGTAVSVSASELVSGTYAVSSSGTSDVTNYASVSVPSQTLPTAVSSSSVGANKASIRPNIGSSSANKYLNIPAGFNDTAQYYVLPPVSINSLQVTQNGTYDCEDYGYNGFDVVTVNVSGGGGEVAVNYANSTLDTHSSQLAFSSLRGEPTSFSFFCTTGASVPTSNESNKIIFGVFDGDTSTQYGKAEALTPTNGSQVNTAAFEYTYSNATGTLTLYAVGCDFAAGTYVMLYSYNGSSANVHTQDVQVGSGATSITFTGLDDEPICWSCIFKSSFSTSSGYQRVIGTVYFDDEIGGLAMDSSAHWYDSSWTWSYNNGSLTITSVGTNNGGYFHQPGYYQLTYVVGGDQSLQTKTVTPTTSTQNVTADTGYTALKKVVVNPIPSSYVQPTATKGATTYTPSTSNQTIASGTYLTGTQTISGDTNLVAGNIKSGTTIFGVTGTYTGGGGGSVQYDTKTVTASNYPVSLEFTGMKGQPKAFVVRLNTSISSSGSTTYYYIVDISAFGTTTHGNCFRIGSTRQVTSITSGYSWSYSGTTLTITSSAASRSASPGAFYSGSYELLYAY